MLEKIDQAKKEKLIHIILPKPIKQPVMELLESDPTSCFYYACEQSECTYDFYLIEWNKLNNYTICHLFSTDILSNFEYLYQSMTLHHIQLFSKLAKLLS